MGRYLSLINDVCAFHAAVFEINCYSHANVLQKNQHY